MKDIEIGFLGLVVTCLLFAAAVGWWLSWRAAVKWSEDAVRQAYRYGRKSAGEDIAKQFKIELGAIKAEKELKRELLGK